MYLQDQSLRGLTFRRCLLAVVALALLLGLVSALTPAHAERSFKPGGCFWLEYVIDGDTVIAEDCNSGTEYRIRLEDVDAPELDEPGGEAARAELQRVLSASLLWIFKWSGETSYDRFVGVIVWRSHDVNRQMNDYLREAKSEAKSKAKSEDDTEAQPAVRVSDPSCRSTATGWITIGPCYRGSFGYQARYDADNDGVSCELGCRVYRSPVVHSDTTRADNGSSSGGGWVTIGPCNRGSSCYSPLGDGDGDGVSCERGCRVWRP